MNHLHVLPSKFASQPFEAFIFWKVPHPRMIQNIQRNLRKAKTQIFERTVQNLFLSLSSFQKRTWKHWKILVTPRLLRSLGNHLLTSPLGHGFLWVAGHDNRIYQETMILPLTIGLSCHIFLYLVLGCKDFLWRNLVINDFFGYVVPLKKQSKISWREPPASPFKDTVQTSWCMLMWELQGPICQAFPHKKKSVSQILVRTVDPIPSNHIIWHDYSITWLLPRCCVWRMMSVCCWLLRPLHPYDMVDLEDQTMSPAKMAGSPQYPINIPLIICH